MSTTTTTNASTLKTFTIREGDGNQGTFRRGSIDAVDAFAALRKASRTRMIYKPKCVTLTSMEGDDECAVLSDHQHLICGDYCAWVAEAILE